MQPFDNVRHIAFAGMDGLILYFGGKDVTQMNAVVSAYHLALKANPPIWLKEAIPSYDSLLILFDAKITDSHGVYRLLRQLQPQMSSGKSLRRHRIPVWYGAPEANDLDEVASHTGLAVSEIIALHTATVYRVFAVGFAPGFAYLGESPERLSVPRRKTPRTKVPAGAVALADRQAAVYPQMSPGGWQLLGLSPLTLFDPASAQPALLQAGDEVEFYEIDEREYLEQVKA